MPNRFWPSTKERFVAFRNSLYADSGFRALAARFPLTRGVARSRAAESFDLVAGFVYSQVLAAVVACDLLAVVSTGPTTSETVAQRCDLPLAGALRLLRAAASLDLVESLGDDRWMLGRVGATVHADAGIVAMIRHHALLYADLAEPLALLRRGGGGGQLAAHWPYAGGGDAGVSGYSALMAASQPMVAAQALAAYRFGRHRAMLDVGGGTGAFSAAIGARHPALRRGVFDLPEVVAHVLDPAVAVHPGNFKRDPLPRGYDLITLVRILHDHDDADIPGILARARAALEPGGRLLIVEPMAETSGARAMGDAYFGMYLLAMGSGRPRTATAYVELARNAGFASAKMVTTPQPIIASIVVASA